MKPYDSNAFGELAYTFSEVVLEHFKDSCTLVDLEFDVYDTLSAKDALPLLERTERARGSRNM